MRIACLSDYSPNDVHIWSGTPYYVYQALQKKHDVTWIGGGIIEGARWHHLMLGEKSIFHPENYSKEIGRILSEMINAGNFDVVITSTYHFCVSLEIKIPVIFFSDVTFPLFRDSFRNKDSRYHMLAMDTERRCLECSDAIVYSSEWAKRDAVSSYNIPPEKIHVVEFGANIPEPKCLLCESPNNAVCQIVFVGREWKRKGGAKMLEIYQILQSQGFPCNLTMIGCAIPDELSIEGVNVFPYLDKADPKSLNKYEEILRNADFLVLPTEFDAYGIVFCEASAYGVPSITADVGGVSQPVRSGVNGALLPPNATAEQYAQKIRSIFENKDEYLRLRKDSRSEYVTRLNWDKWCERVTDIARSLIKKVENESTIIEEGKERIEYKDNVLNYVKKKTGSLRKNCVITTVGKNSLHPRWIENNSDRSFDLHAIVYDYSYESYLDSSDFLCHRCGQKLKLIYAYLKQNPHFLEHYSYFFIPDDDILTSCETIEQLFEIMEEYQLQIAQPSLRQSYYTFPHTLNEHYSCLRYTNFVEMMVPCFSREALNKVLDTFDSSESGWGIEYHWPILIESNHHDMAIIDQISVCHTRPVQTGRIHNMKDMHIYMSKHELSPQIIEYGYLPMGLEADSPELLFKLHHYRKGMVMRIIQSASMIDQCLMHNDQREEKSRVLDICRLFHGLANESEAVVFDDKAKWWAKQYGYSWMDVINGPSTTMILTKLKYQLQTDCSYLSNLTYQTWRMLVALLNVYKEEEK